LDVFLKVIQKAIPAQDAKMRKGLKIEYGFMYGFTKYLGKDNF